MIQRPPINYHNLSNEKKKKLTNAKYFFFSLSFLLLAYFIFSLTYVQEATCVVVDSRIVNKTADYFQYQVALRATKNTQAHSALLPIYSGSNMTELTEVAYLYGVDTFHDCTVRPITGWCIETLGPSKFPIDNRCYFGAWILNVMLLLLYILFDCVLYSQMLKIRNAPDDVNSTDVYLPIRYTTNGLDGAGDTSSSTSSAEQIDII